MCGGGFSTATGAPVAAVIAIIHAMRIFGLPVDMRGGIYQIPTVLYRGLHYLLVVMLGAPSLAILEMLHRRGEAAGTDPDPPLAEAPPDGAA